MVKEGVVNLNFFFFAELTNWFKIATGRRAGGLAVGSTEVIVILGSHKVPFIITGCHEFLAYHHWDKRNWLGRR
jgi:hypothetical protein